MKVARESLPKALPQEKIWESSDDETEIRLSCFFSHLTAPEVAALSLELGTLLQALPIKNAFLASNIFTLLFCNFLEYKWSASGHS